MKTDTTWTHPPANVCLPEQVHNIKGNGKLDFDFRCVVPGWNESLTAALMQFQIRLLLCLRKTRSANVFIAASLLLFAYKFTLRVILQCPWEVPVMCF